MTENVRLLVQLPKRLLEVTLIKQSLHLDKYSTLFTNLVCLVYTIIFIYPPDLCTAFVFTVKEIIVLSRRTIFSVIKNTLLQFPIDKVSAWMEVDDSHPTMLAQWLAPGSKEWLSLSVEYCNTDQEMNAQRLLWSRLIC